jgi:hypothetical protein
MNWFHSPLCEPYNIDKTFTQTKISGIKPVDIHNWLAVKCFGRADYNNNEGHWPALPRASMLYFMKNSVNFFMPNNHPQWCNDQGNPTKSALVNDLITLVKKFEARREGAPSQVKHPLTQTHTKASLAILIGLPLQHARTWLPYILSYHHTAVNHLWVTCVPPSTPSITSVRHTTTGSLSPPQPWLPFTHISTSWTKLTLKPTWMLNLHLLITAPLLLLTVTDDRVLLLVWQFVMARCFLYLNF